MYNRIRNVYACKIITHEKCHFANTFNRIGNGYTCEATAEGKRLRTDAYNRIRNVYACKLHTTAECTVTDAFNRIGNGYVCNIVAARKCTAADFSHAVRYNCISNAFLFCIFYQYAIVCNLKPHILLLYNNNIYFRFKDFLIALL